MYKVYLDSDLIYDDEIPEVNRLKLSSPTLDIDVSSAGTFSAKIPPTNTGYDNISLMTSTIEVYRDDTWLWTGRPLTMDEDFFGIRNLKCEGALSFLNDIIIPLKKYENKQLSFIVNDILSIYNSKAAISRKIYRGTISSTTEGGSPINTYSMVSDNNTAMECITNIIEYWGLYPRIRKSSDKLYLDLITSNLFDMSTQRIDFGVNLLDFTKENDWSGVVTSILPLGKELETHEESGDENYPDRVNISSVNGGSKYLIRTADKNKYGIIEQKVEWNDIDDPATLKQLAQTYLNDLQFGDLTINITVADLHYLTKNVPAFKLYTQVNCYSKPHNLDKTFVITKMSIPFDDPENTKFTFSKLTYGSMGSSSVISTGKTMSNIAGSIPKITDLRKMARVNAANLILSATTGFVSLVQSQDGSHVEYLSITNQENMDDSTARWIWNANGLMFQSRNSKDNPWDPANTKVALTKEGEIVADMITTGVIRAGENYINLDTGQIQFLSTVKFGDKTVDDIIETSEAAAETVEDVSLLKKGSTNSVDVQYGMSSSSNTKPTSWSTTANSLWAKQGKFIWTRQKITMFDGGVKYSTPRLLSDGRQLIKEIREQYYMSTSKVSPVGGKWGDQQQAYENKKYYFTRSRIEWVDGRVTYEPSVNGELAQSFTTVRDVYDSMLDQKSVFDKLTNNGKAKGIITDSKGNLYFNADYISTGIISDKKNKNYWNLNTGDFRLAAITELDDKIKDIKVGGENLIDGTSDWAGWIKRGNFVINGDTASSAPRAITDNNQWNNSMMSRIGKITYGHIMDKEVTVSFDMKTTSSWGTIASKNAVNVNIRLCDSTNTRKRWQTWRVEQAPISSWKRYNFTFIANSSTFVGGKDTSALTQDLLLGIEIYNRSNKQLSIRNVKVELGNVATDWGTSANDVTLIAAKKASAAETAAKSEAVSRANEAQSKAYKAMTSYVDPISKQNRQYTVDQRNELDASFTQEKTFNKLTNNGKVLGMQMVWVDKNGNRVSDKSPNKHHQEFHINATFIKSGVVNGNLIRSGVILPKSSSKGDFRINMETGYINAANMELSNMNANGKVTTTSGQLKTSLEGGQIRFFKNNKSTGYIDGSVSVKDLSTGTTGNGIQITTVSDLRISTPYVSTLNSSNANRTTTKCITGSVFLNDLTYDMANGMSRCYTGSVELKFVNGLFVGVGKYTNPMVTVKYKN